MQPSGSRIPDGWSKKLAFLLIVTFYLTEAENRTKKSLTQLLYITFSKGTILVQKQLIFCKNNADIININEVLVLKGIFSKTKCMWEYFRSKFQVSSIIVASLRQGSWGGWEGNFNPPTPKRAPKKKTSLIRVNTLNTALTKYA